MTKILDLDEDPKYFTRKEYYSLVATMDREQLLAEFRDILGQLIVAELIIEEYNK